MLVSRNVFHVVSALQAIVSYYFFFWLIRSLVDPTLAAFIVCGPLQSVLLTCNYAAAGGGGGEGVLPYMGYIGMCGLKGYGFSAVLGS